jgi:hypothetical protein
MPRHFFTLHLPLLVALGAATTTSLTVGQPPAVEEVGNPLVAQLVEQGIRLPDGTQAALPPPVALDGLDPGTLRERLRPVYQRHGWERFSRRSQVAPLELKLGTVSDHDQKRQGHTVSVWFIAYGNFQALLDSQMVEQLASDLGKEASESGEAEYAFRELDEVELTRFGLERVERDGFRETWIHGAVPVLNRVEVQGVAHSVVTHDEQTLWVAWQIDPRFPSTGNLANQWRSFERNDLGERELGPFHGYLGYAGYGRIMRLAEPEGALWIECHVVLHEPEGWFAGSNALRAKIPLGIQENVRKFRRELGRLEP